jgi:hypothetical protein
MPSTKAYAPKRRTNAASVMPGQKNVITPKTMAAMPRNRTDHHASETTASNEFMGTSQLTALKEQLSSHVDRMDTSSQRP